jgi:hypothetical protein
VYHNVAAVKFKPCVTDSAALAEAQCTTAAAAVGKRGLNLATADSRTTQEQNRLYAATEAANSVKQQVASSLSGRYSLA